MGPAPMPPQGAQAAPESAPPSGGGVSQIISGAHDGITKVLAMLQAKPDAVPGGAEHLEAAVAALDAFVDAVSGEGQPGPAVGTPEQGANPNAKPMV
jgi:hypothetical protein